MNNSRGRTNLEFMKSPMKHEKVITGKVEMQGSRLMDAENPTKSRGASTRERKMALQQDVNELKKKLRHEENVHRALKRAFTRPLGALPRLPPYLPPYILELVAEVAVLEEEVVRLEEQVLHFIQALNSSSRRNFESSVKNSKQKQSKFSPQTKGNLPTLRDDGGWKENQPGISSARNNQLTNPKVQTTKTPQKRPPNNQELWTTKVKTTNAIRDQRSSGDENPNKISEDIVRCLSIILLRMSSSNDRSTSDTLPSLSVLNSGGILEATGFKDPYGIGSEFGRRDIGPYEHLLAVEALSINPTRKTNSVFLVRRLKILLGKLASVKLKGLTQQEKLAFWINTHNSCVMNACLEHGIPDSPEMVVELMQKATVNVGGHLVDAITIEDFILRQPYHSNHTFAKGTKNKETTARSAFGLELSEPLVTFALSCGSWSSPAVRVYTASEVENELKVAKKEYLLAAIGISTKRKLLGIPKILDRYLLDFAKGLESFLDWSLQLPSELGKEAN